MSERITHGRHCACSACARQDWSEPQLAPCGMHGSSCPGRYDPWGVAGALASQPVVERQITEAADALLEVLERVEITARAGDALLEALERVEITAQAGDMEDLDTARHDLRAALGAPSQPEIDPAYL